MLLWFIGTAWVSIWLVLKDPSFDYRMLAVGALAPDIVDGVTGGVGVAHALPVSALLLGVVMIVTRGRRAVRKRWLALPFGTMMHLVFDGAFASTAVFWWPFGGSLPDEALPSIERGVLSVVLEVIGVGLIVWWIRTFRLTEADRRRRFVATGAVTPC
jgi:hypothetical protein